ncbi:hypothetical protein ACI2OX_14420 [Bacillus sp. N9]
MNRLLEEEPDVARGYNYVKISFKKVYTLNLFNGDRGTEKRTFV